MSRSHQPAADAGPTLDVREIEGEPFEDIMAALDDLSVGETLYLVAPFEPEPLYGVLDERGFDHETDRTDSGAYRVAISPADDDSD